MTVNSATSTASYLGNGTTQVFPVPFYFLVDTDIKVSRKLSGATTSTVLTLNSDYTLSGSGNQLGGSLTMLVAPAADDQIFIERNVAAVQQTAYPENNKFPSASHEKALDRLTMLIQQALSKLTFGLFRDPLGSTYDLGNGTLINGGTAVNANDVPNLVQVQGLIVGGAAPSLVGPNGSALVGFLQAGTGAVARTVQDKGRDVVSALDFMSAAQVADVRGNVGSLDVTAAFQAALTYVCTNGGCLYVPRGRYKITAPLVITGTNIAAGSDINAIHFKGDGHASRLLHAFDGKLFTCSGTAVPYFTFENFSVISTTSKSAGNVCFYFAGGIVRSKFQDIRIGADSGGTSHSPAGFFDCGTSSQVDTVEFNRIHLESITGQGYGIGKGSAIYINDGRIIGANTTTPIGIYCYGGNGGIWIKNTDIINLFIGMKLTADNGSNNREIFLSQVAFDSSSYGLYAMDASYINSIGCWASAAKEACMYLHPNYTGTLNVSGGTIFNAGAIPGGTFGGVGLLINAAAYVNLSGVEIRGNAGYGVYCPNSLYPTNGSITGCQIYGNGIGLGMAGGVHIADNRFNSNTTNIAAGSVALWIENNMGENVSTFTTAPAMVASGGTYTYTGNYPYAVYITGGSGLVIFLNGQSIFQSSDVVIPIKKGDAIGITYTTVPTWRWSRQ